MDKIGKISDEFIYSYLLEVKRIPLTPPKVDIATNMGTRKAKYPNTLSANVTATASLPYNEFITFSRILNLRNQNLPGKLSQ